MNAHRPARLAALTLSTLMAASALGAPRPLKKLTVDGWADIQGGQQAAARDAAIRDAQKKALEMTAGVHIQAAMSDQSLSKIQGGKETFQQEVSSKILTNTQGFVQGFKVLKEGVEGTTYKVALEVETDDLALGRQLAILARQLAGARFPKLMFVVSEEYTAKGGERQVVEEPTLQSALEDALLARGFDLVAKEQIEKLRREEADVFSGILTDDNKAAKYAMEYGAEYVIVASGRVQHTSFNDLGQKEHHGFAELSLKAINASSAALVASNKQSGNSPANCFSEAELRVKAVTHVAPKLLENLQQRIMESWDRETENGIRYAVKLYNVKNYREHGRRFMELLQHIPAVKQLKKISYGGDRLELEVFYPMVHDVSHLENAIMDAIAADKAFKKLDVTYSRGRELNFKM